MLEEKDKNKGALVIISMNQINSAEEIKKIKKIIDSASNYKVSFNTERGEILFK